MGFKLDTKLLYYYFVQIYLACSGGDMLFCERLL